MRTKSGLVWTGYWLIAVAVLHTIATGIFFGDVFIGMWQKGLFNSVGRDPMIGLAVWFFLFGPVLAMLGAAITSLEKASDFSTSNKLAWGLLLLSVVGVVLMPDSGFWLAFPPAFALIYRSFTLSPVRT
ncbi:MAG: DUF6463 family protein [Undibacterium umbellatum]|uniref:DUF6463 family protein n=1 Tax=Undibacterium umbellatum TaxID=2762300 RepID=UPI003BB51507